ncbi:Dabb family protein [Egicoccus sp. AB-alg2]|uniref:Dabb family protein n=1 Tax=Egicoccus sp. AB-alg2 TaxID=3242693 RepID=UPI00359D8837
MILHAVRFDCSGVDEADRREFEDGLAALADLDVVLWLRVGRDLTDPAVTGLLTAHADADALEAYRVHPDHQPSVQRVASLGIPATRFDIEVPDVPAQGS